MERRWLGLIAIVAAVALIFAACGGDDDESTPEAPAATEVAGDQGDTSPPASADSEEDGIVAPDPGPQPAPTEATGSDDARSRAAALLLEAEEIQPNYAQNQEDVWNTDPEAESDGPLGQFDLAAAGWIGSLERDADNMELQEIFMDPSADPSQLDGLDLAVQQQALFFERADGAQSAIEFFQSLTLLELTAELVPAADPAGFELSEFELEGAGERSRGLLLQGAQGSAPPGLPVGVLATAVFQRAHVIIILGVSSFQEPRFDLVEAIAAVLDTKIGEL